MKNFNYTDFIFHTDNHFGLQNNNMEWLAEYENYYINYFIPLIKKQIAENPTKKYVLQFLGDWFDNRQTLNIKVFTKSKDILKEILKVIPVHMILGNHDVYYTDSNEVSSVAALFELDNLIIFKNPEVCKYKHISVLHLPWVKDKEKLNNYVENNKADIIFTHTDINDLRLNSRKKIEFGLDIKALKNFKLCYNGHIHLNQQIKNIHNLGNPFHMDRKDKNNVKGTYMLDTKTLKETFIENDFSPKIIDIFIKDLIDIDISEIEQIVKRNIIDLHLEQSLMIKHRVKNNLIIKEIEKHCYKILDISIDGVEVEEDIDVAELQNSYDFSEIVEEFIYKKITDEEVSTERKKKLFDMFNKTFKELSK